MTTFINYL